MEKGGAVTRATRGGRNFSTSSFHNNNSVNRSRLTDIHLITKCSSHVISLKFSFPLNDIDPFEVSALLTILKYNFDAGFTFHPVKKAETKAFYVFLHEFIKFRLSHNIKEI